MDEHHQSRRLVRFRLPDIQNIPLMRTILHIGESRLDRIDRTAAALGFIRLHLGGICPSFFFRQLAITIRIRIGITFQQLLQALRLGICRP